MFYCLIVTPNYFFCKIILNIKNIQITPLSSERFQKYVVHMAKTMFDLLQQLIGQSNFDSISLTSRNLKTFTKTGDQIDYSVLSMTVTLVICIQSFIPDQAAKEHAINKVNYIPLLQLHKEVQRERQTIQEEAANNLLAFFNIKDI